MSRPACIVGLRRFRISERNRPVAFGIRVNYWQVVLQLLQVLLVGMTVGMTRNVVPALAETEFGVPRGSFMLLVAFVVAFGVVKGAMNFVAGRLAERIGRKKVLLAGWLVAFPIAPLIYFAQSWSWVVVATMLLGVNQGLTWSMTQTAKLDITRPDQRGLVIGLNEFSGYVGVAVAGVVTGYAASVLGPRAGLLWFGTTVVLLATLLAWLAVAETLPWARFQSSQEAIAYPEKGHPQPNRFAAGEQPTGSEVFALMSWRDRRMAALCQAGLVEKFVDALVWVFWPVYLHQRGVSLPGIGWIVGVYGFTWGGAQLFTGRLSDRVGRHHLNVLGMWVCGVGVLLLPLGKGSAWWSFAAAVAGIGMAMLYPNLSAAVADLAQPAWRASAIGIYRFWRDLGYGVGALGLGAAAALGGSVEYAFWFVALAMGMSGLVLYHWGEETHTRFNPAP
nr:MFS transporter [Paraburkholderia fungorum]